MCYSLPGVLLPSLPSSFLSYIPPLLFLNKATVLRNEVRSLIMLPPIRTNHKKQKKKMQGKQIALVLYDHFKLDNTDGDYLSVKIGL